MMRVRLGETGAHKEVQFIRVPKCLETRPQTTIATQRTWVWCPKCHRAERTCRHLARSPCEAATRPCAVALGDKRRKKLQQQLKKEKSEEERKVIRDFLAAVEPVKASEGGSNSNHTGSSSSSSTCSRNVSSGVAQQSAPVIPALSTSNNGGD